MNPDEMNDRFEELSAGLALGDLDREEVEELRALCGVLGREPDESLAVAAASLDAALSGKASLPGSLAARLRAMDFAGPQDGRTGSKVVAPLVPAWRRLFRHGDAGWAAAALFFVLLIVQGLWKSGSPARPSVDELVAEAPDLLRVEFSGLGEYGSAGGEVVWSDVRQEGYLLLTGLPENDPARAQYQLWIVDPARDPDAPVDGGVFDVTVRGGEAVIPIDAKLPVRRPRAFVITLEQPGGVVKSKQETVVALAKI